MFAATSINQRSRHVYLTLGAIGMAVCANAALASPWSWIFGEEVAGSGTIKQQIRDIGHFTAISLDAPAAVELRQGSAERITIETDDNLIPLIKAFVENGSLKIQSSRKNTRLRPTSLKIIVEAKTIHRLSVKNSGSIHAGRLDSLELSVNIGGPGDIHIKTLQSKELAVSLGGGAVFEAAGGADSVSLSIGGSGDVQTGNLASDEVSISLGGAGRAVVWARKRLRLSLAGSGSVSYYGDPEIGKSATGPVSVTRLGSVPR